MKSLTIDNIVSKLDQKKIPYNNTVMLIRLPEPITKPGKVTMELTVEASTDLAKQLNFVIGLYNNKKDYLVPSVKPGNADEIKNNDSLTLKSETEQSLLFNKRSRLAILMFIVIIIVIIILLLVKQLISKDRKSGIPKNNKRDGYGSKNKIIGEDNFKYLPLKEKLEYVIGEIEYLRLITNESVSKLNKRKFPTFKVKVPVSEVNTIKLTSYNIHILTPNILSKPESFKDIQWADLFSITNEMGIAVNNLKNSCGNVEKIKEKLESLTNDASLMEDLQAINAWLKEELEFIQSVRKILDNEKKTRSTNIGSTSQESGSQKTVYQEKNQPTVTFQETGKQTTTTKKAITLEDLYELLDGLDARMGILEIWKGEQIKEHKKGSSDKGFSVSQQSNTPLDIFVRSYNEAVDNPKKLGDFNKKYQITRIDVINAMERRQNSSIEPIFQTSSSGAYITVKIDGLSGYAVVPRPGIAIDDFLYLPGAAGMIFDCLGYSQGNSYEKAKVINPAHFDTDESRQIWTFKKKGDLDLKSDSDRSFEANQPTVTTMALEDLDKLNGLDDRVKSLESLKARMRSLEGLNTKVKSLEDLDARMKSLEALNARVESLENSEAGVKSLGDLDAKMENLEDWIKAHIKEHKKSGSGKGQQPIGIFVRSYNEAVDNNQKLADFYKDYQTVRIGAANAMDRRRDLSIEPVFQASNSGAYIAVKIDGLSRYAVVPRPGTAINDYIYVSSAAGIIFDCPGYQQGRSYEKVKVVKPALFDTDNSIDIWTFKEKGELELK